MSAGGLAGVLSLLFPNFVLGLLAFSVPFGESLRLPIGDLSITMTEVMVAALSMAWFLRAATQRRLSWPGAGIWLPLGAFLAIATFSMTLAASPGLSGKEIIKWLELGLVMTLAVDLLKRERVFLLIVGALLIAGALEALYGLNQARTGAGPIGFLLGHGPLRAFGTFGQPNPFAAYLALLLSLSLGLCFAFLTQARTKFVSIFGLVLLGSTAIMLLALLASFSRSALLALGAATLVMIAIHSRQALLLLVGGLLIVGLLFLLGVFWLLPELFTSRFSALAENFVIFDPRAVTLTSENFALVQRMAIWQAAWDMFVDHPLLGVGIGNFDVGYLRYALPHWPYLPGHAHNYYLNLLAEVGLLGLSAYLALLGTLWGCTLQALRQVRRLQRQSFGKGDFSVYYGAALGAVGLLAVLTVHNLFDNLYVHGMPTLVGLILALGLAAQRLAAGSATAHPAEPMTHEAMSYVYGQA